MKKQTLLIFFCLILFSIGGYFAHQRNHYNLTSTAEIRKVKAQLALLSKEERKDLEFFFSYATLFSQYSYTLVHSKPMSICNFLEWADDLPAMFKNNYQKPRSKLFFDSLSRGHRAWDKYQKLFPCKEYPIVSHHQSKSSGLKEISLIHPTLCKKVIQENIADFHEVLASPYSAEEIFSIITNPEHPLFYPIIEHHRLLGILLGFGRTNAYLFEHKLRDQLTSFTKEWPHWPRKWRLPAFVCNPNTEETQTLKNTYVIARRHIRWTYLGRNNLEVTLALLEKKPTTSAYHNFDMHPDHCDYKTHNKNISKD
jgi:hypothetical protein